MKSIAAIGLTNQRETTVIREPLIVKKFREGGAEKVGCVSCNRCLSAAANNLPVHCYQKQIPMP